MKKITIICLLTALFSGCSNEKERNTELNTPQEFRFQSYLQEGNKITPLGTTRTLGGTLDKGYKLIGAITRNQDFRPGENTGSSYSYGITKIFWNDQTDANGNYEGEKRFWDTDPNIRHTFYAYSSNPTDTPAGCGVAELLSNSMTNASGFFLPTIRFIQHDDPAKQIDLLVANPIANITVKYATPTVNFYFRHALSRIVLRLIGSGGATLTDCRATFQYKNNVSNNTYIRLPMSLSLNSNYHTQNVDYTLNNDFILPPDAMNDATAFTMGEMILLPQSLSDGFIEITVRYRPTEESDLKTVSVQLPKTTLGSETQYVFLLKIVEDLNSLVVSSIILEPWNAESGMVDELK